MCFFIPSAKEKKVPQFGALLLRITFSPDAQLISGRRDAIFQKAQPVVSLINFFQLFFFRWKERIYSA
jgi:hypothetical protein